MNELGVAIVGSFSTLPPETKKDLMNFVRKICEPAAEELGLWAKDKIRFWRFKNICSMLEKAQGKIIIDEKSNMQIHPRVMEKIFEGASWQDDDVIQEMWAGLLVSSTSTNKYLQDENIIFSKLLEQLTIPEVLLINHICKTSYKELTPSGLVVAKDLVRQYGIAELQEIMKVKEEYIIDRAIDHLISLNLFPAMRSGFDTINPILSAHLNPTALCLNLYVRAQGYKDDPAVFWKLRSSSTMKNNELNNI